MIDFSGCAVKNRLYSGANGEKISIVYQEELYMLKFPAPPTKNPDMSYINSCISEYIGCHIFESVGIPVQETMLGTYERNGKIKVVVACKDFTSNGMYLQDFASLKNSVADSNRHGYGTDLKSVLYAIDQQAMIDSKQLREHFWNMFIVDALIGNWDRHNGNWGFLYNLQTDEIKLAPVYDCGSSLYPQANEQMIKDILTNRQERDMRIFSIPTSALSTEGKRINYFNFISSLDNKDCNRALKRMCKRIDLNKITGIIDNTPYITNLQKDFYKTMLSERKERILDFSLKKLRKRELELDMER